MRISKKAFSYSLRTSIQDSKNNWTTKEATEGFEMEFNPEDTDLTLFECMKEDIKARVLHEVMPTKTTTLQPITTQPVSGLNLSKIKEVTQ